MKSEKCSKNIFTIPAGISLSRALAGHLLQQFENTPEDLSAIRIMLPTRRACRILREAFLQMNEGRPLLLPYMHSIGDIDEDELSLSFFNTDIAALPAAISPLKRQMLLTRLIMKLPAYAGNPARSMALAQTLGRLLDQMIIEGLDPALLHTLVPEDFATHWQITLEFLKILTEQWPQILSEQGVIDSTARREILIRTLATQWHAAPPPTRIIAAGNIGSNPATATLLKVIAELPNGQVVLPGLDQDMEEASWDVLPPDHAQYSLKILLQSLGCERQQVNLWPCQDTKALQARRFLASEIMRPAKTTAAWQSLSLDTKAQQSITEAVQNIHRFDCENEAEESQVIALLLREALETPNRTAALITPDRALAHRVVQACQRWGISLDDSSGTPLSLTRVGTFLRLIPEAVQAQLAPVALLALLKHDLCSLGQLNAPFRKTVDLLEIKALRGTRPQPGFKGIHQRLEGLNDKGLNTLISKLETVLQPVLAMSQDNALQDFGSWLKTHIELAETLAEGAQERGESRLWAGEEGEACAGFLADLMTQVHMMPRVTLQDYGTMLTALMQAITLRPRYGTHPRLMVLGPLEARMVHADLVILGGLNEGTWPADPGHDPWMSRPMRESFGLPALERSTGLAAHDFQQAFCTNHVALTRSRRAEGAPSVPSRWLQRLDTVLKACNTELAQAPHLDWARAQDRPALVKPIERPAPRPPAAARPKEISITRVETWLQDPYAIYARYILKLTKLDPLDKAPDAAERGSVLHNMLERFITACPQEIPPEAENILLGIAREELQQKYDDPAIWRLWWPRLTRMACWLASHERNWRETAQPLKLEATGRMDLLNGQFTLTGKADRIDKTPDGKALIIDYKSGGIYTQKDLNNGKLPQLPLEASMVSTGAFPGIIAMPVQALSYWKLTGGRNPGEEITVIENIAALADAAKAGLENIAAIFADETVPYYAVPRLDNIPRFNDYEHLSLIREWSVLGDTGEEAA